MVTIDNIPEPRVLPFDAEPFWPGYSGGRLSSSPDRLRISPSREIDSSHGSARAFSVLNGRCVVFSSAGHPTILGVLRLRGKNPKFQLSGFGVKARPALSEADVAWYQQNWIGELGALRERTLSGRVWRNLKLGGIRVSVMSFWVCRKRVSGEVLARIVDALTLKGRIWVEFLDSKGPHYLWPD